MSALNMVATCMFGLEKFLGEEIDALGCRRTLTMDGRVFFEGGPGDVARANLRLRTAERVYVLAGPGFPAATFDQLFEGVRALPWEDFIDSRGAFPVSGHCVKSALTSVPSCQSIVKKAMCVRLGSVYGYRTLPEDGTEYPVSFFLFKDTAYLMIDTSGVSLHKRGYRPSANQAPLRETLAAALVMNARIRDGIFLWDPFCGSGTIAIEGAMYAMNIAPGLRRSFCSESFGFLPAGSFAEARGAALGDVRDCGFRARGTDISSECIETARENAARAGVADRIEFYTGDATRIKKPDGDIKGTLICNPPYGERMMTVREAEELYRAMGRAFSGFGNWQIYVLTSCEYFEKLYGRRADRTRKLYNGTIPCLLYQYYRPRS